jgi:Family of unknown function (DUF5706)
VTDPDPVHTAWRIHAAIADWTGRVDAKASFALTIESALLAGIIAMSASDRRLSNLSGFVEYAFFSVGVALLVVGVLMAAWVVRPRLRWRKLEAEATSNFIYFGHLRHWTPDRLAETLRTDDPLPVIARQVINMSHIAWAKHRLVQHSLACAVGGIVCVTIGAAITTGSS